MFRVKFRVVHTLAFAFFGAKVLLRLRVSGTNDNRKTSIDIRIYLEK